MRRHEWCRMNVVLCLSMAARSSKGMKALAKEGKRIAKERKGKGEQRDKPALQTTVTVVVMFEIAQLHLITLVWLPGATRFMDHQHHSSLHLSAIT